MRRVRVEVCSVDSAGGRWWLSLGGIDTRPFPAQAGMSRSQVSRGLETCVREYLDTFPTGMVDVIRVSSHAFDVCGPLGTVALMIEGILLLGRIERQTEGGHGTVREVPT